MVRLTAATLSAIAGKPVNDNMRSAIAGLDAYGASSGLDKPHRLAHYIGQLGHESGGFRFDREVWGPTPAQKRYEGRKDLGNTQPGDGEKFKGHTPGQITGRANTTAFRNWCRAQGLNPPDFVETPELMNTDPWEGLGPIWYWSVGNPTGKNLNGLADANDIEMITRRINGGTNGLSNRINWYVRAALVLLGFKPDGVAAFQRQAQADGLLPAGADQIDGIAGPKTRAALHKTLAAQSPHTATKAAPVVEKTAPQGAEKTSTLNLGLVATVGGTLLSNLGTFLAGLHPVVQGAGLALIAIGLFVLWRDRAAIAKAAKAILRGQA